ncbi:hypothetical protein, partial [Caballeronia glebae]|uniref:hypothetical protein n=1 Tax=Caballeronia glebae TaxID=1777143 RepID=UPI0038BA2808
PSEVETRGSNRLMTHIDGRRASALSRRTVPPAFTLLRSGPRLAVRVSSPTMDWMGYSAGATDRASPAADAHTPPYNATEVR